MLISRLWENIILRLTLEFYDIFSMIRKAKGDDTNDLEIEALENGEIKTEGDII